MSKKKLNLMKDIIMMELKNIHSIEVKNTHPTCLCNFPPFLPIKAASKPENNVSPPAIAWLSNITFSKLILLFALAN